MKQEEYTNFLDFLMRKQLLSGQAMAAMIAACDASKSIPGQPAELGAKLILAELVKHGWKCVIAADQLISEWLLPKMIGPFCILKVLGQGAMGAVYLGQHKDLGLRVAIKVILGFVDAETLERFRREAKVVIGLSHPNFVRGYTVDLDHDPRYIAIEVVEGSDFGEGIQSYPDVYAKIEKLRDVCRGVQAMHAQGLVHRDLKPANIRLDLTGRAVVMDPGMVKSVAGKDVERAARAVSAEALPELTNAGAILGTPMYMAPEQVDERAPVSPATDVYALGKIIFNTLTGEQVHLGRDMISLFKAITGAEVPAHVAESMKRVFADKADCDRFLRILMKALDPQPANRYQAAGELEAVLTGFLDWRIQRQRDERERERMQAEAQQALIRKLAIGSVVGGILLAVSLLAVIFFAWANQAEQKAAEEAKGRLAEAQARAEAESKSARDAQARAEAESAARQADARRLNVAERLNVGQRKMAEADWRGAISVYEAILAIDAECYAARWPLAEAQYNVFDLSFIEHYRWLAAHAPSDEEQARARFWVVFAGLDRGAVTAEQAPGLIGEIHEGFYRDLADLYFAMHERTRFRAMRNTHEAEEWDRKASVLLEWLDADHWLVAFIHGFSLIDGDPDRAIERLTVCISKNPSFPMAYYWRAAILNEDPQRPSANQRRQPLAAVHDAERLHALMPGWPKGELTRVQSYLFMAQTLSASDVDAALTWFDRAQDLLKQEVYNTWQARTGNVYEEQGGSIEGNTAYVFYHRADILRRAGRWDDALAAIEQADSAMIRLQSYVDGGRQIPPNMEALRQQLGPGIAAQRRKVQMRQR